MTGKVIRLFGRSVLRSFAGAGGGGAAGAESWAALVLVPTVVATLKPKPTRAEGAIQKRAAGAILARAGVLKVLLCRNAAKTGNGTHTHM